LNIPGIAISSTNANAGSAYNKNDQVFGTHFAIALRYELSGS